MSAVTPLRLDCECGENPWIIIPENEEQRDESVREFGRLHDHGGFPITLSVLTECPEKPELLDGQPLGMYHCPVCGCMQIAGVPHLPHEEGVCWLGLDEEGSG